MKKTMYIIPNKDRLKALDLLELLEAPTTTEEQKKALRQMLKDLQTLKVKTAV